LEFSSRDNTTDVNITIINDELIESNETYLTSGVGVTLSPYTQIEVTINDDDIEGNDNIVIVQYSE
jgi:hypothetical protein